MTKQEMLNRLETTSGVGVIAKYDDGREVPYFYQDFETLGKGIDRAVPSMMNSPYIVSFTVYK